MNILFLSKIFVNSGVGIHMKDLSAELIRQGHHVWIASGNNEHKDFCDEIGISFEYINFSMNPKSFIKNFNRLKNLIKENNIDIVHCHHRTCGFYMNFLSPLVRIPFVWSNHLSDIPSDFFHRKTTFYGKQVICVSSELKNFCVDKLKIPEEKISVILHGIHPEKYREEPAYVENFKREHNITNERIIGLFARMAPIKGHIYLIEALSKMSPQALEKTRTVFFGGTEGEYVESLKEEIAKRNLEKYIIFEGFVTPSQALSLSDITVLPSLHEGFAIVTIESNLMKKPHIRTKTAGYTDLQEGCIGLELDSDEWKEELESFAQGKDYSQLVDSGYNMVLNKCTIEKMTQSTLAVYNKAISK